MDVCVESESVVYTPATEAMLEGIALAEEAEESDRGSTENSCAGHNPADSAHAKTPQPEPATAKNPWSAWAWLGLCKAPARKIPNIVHVDVDAFFASVEQVLNPRLRGKPVLVGRGCVASASYEAKALGVKTAMGFREALRVCPKAIVVPGQYEHYADFAERVRRILETYTPAVETAALDDFYLDFAGTERLYPDYRGTLVRLQMEVFKETGLSVSLGAARTKVVASIASRLERPRGFRMVAPGDEEAFLTPLPVAKLHGIGHVHTSTLAERGITTIGQLRRVPKAALQAAFGEAIGLQIWERARGLDGREVLLPSTPKSVSRETTIEGGTIDTEFLGGLIEYLSERIGSTLREYGKQARTLGLRLRYVDYFSAHQAVRLIKPTNDERELLSAAKEMFGKLFTRRVAVRLAGVSVTNLEADRRQNDLFDTRANRRWYLNREMDRVRGRFGWNAVFYGKGLALREHYATKPNGLVLSTPCLSR
ncbi:MAG: DNA polymerase IV [Acidobacteria bacterium]|nr:MAG: DNA polymerase IV [Acidobacteriota bacterium]